MRSHCLFVANRRRCQGLVDVSRLGRGGYGMRCPLSVGDLIHDWRCGGEPRVNATIPDQIGGLQRATPTRREKIGEHVVGKQRVTVLGQNAYTEPSGTRCDTNAAASSNSRSGPDVPSIPQFSFTAPTNASLSRRFAQQSPSR